VINFILENSETFGLFCNRCLKNGQCRYYLPYILAIQINGLVNFHNVKFLKMNMANYLRDSQFGKFWKEIEKTKLSVLDNFISDLLRIVLLFNFGGAYFDTDTISRKPIPQEWTNFLSGGEKFLQR